jgi:hypothetical protein
MYSYGDAIGSIITAFGLIWGLIGIGRYWWIGTKMADNVMNEVIRFEKNKQAKKNHNWR